MHISCIAIYQYTYVRNMADSTIQALLLDYYDIALCSLHGIDAL